MRSTGAMTRRANDSGSGAGSNDEAAHPDAWTLSRWRSDTEPLDTFRRSLPNDELGPLLDSVRQLVASGDDVERLNTADLDCGPVTEFLHELRSELLFGSGLALVGGFPVDHLSETEIEVLFWVVGTHLGRAVSQSVMGERLGHVRDMTASDPHARAYRNNARLTPHSDPADLLAFLCIRPATTGGVSRFVSSLAIHDEIERQRPDLLARLTRGFRYHRLGENRPGSPPITPHRVPVFSEIDGVLSCRYVRHYVEVAADEDPDIALDAIDHEAMDLLESLAADPSMHHEFTLGAGEAVFANNFTVLHARSKFSDRTHEGPGRHLLRLWLAAEPGRPLVPEILHYDGEPGIPAVAGRMPSYATEVEVH